MREYDVTIVGLGPTGGTIANLFALNGFSVLILEREKNFYPLPRAVHFDDEIMRVFETIGITKDFLKHTIINKGTKFVNSKGKIILDWPRPRKITINGWYPSYRFNQPDLERQLRKKLKKYKKVKILQNSEVTKIKKSKDHVNVLFKNTKDKVLYEINPDAHIYPASMTKIMTAIVVFDLLKKGETSLDEPITISEKAWRMSQSGYSSMFIMLNDQVSVEDLLKGIIIISGNDACVALAEGLSGSEEDFVILMNEKAEEIGLENTNFNNTSGINDVDNYSTVRDVLKMSKYMIET